MANRQAVWKFVPLTADQYIITNDSGAGGQRCLIFGDNGTSPNPERYNWGPGPFCGFPGGKDALLANRQAVWRLIPMGGNQYVITNASGTGVERCLIFGNNGTGASPERYNWGPGAFCGFPGGKDALLANRQAIWTIEALDHTYASWTLRTILNNSNQIAAVSFPISAGGTVGTNNLLARGDAAVVVPGQGPIVFLDKGHNTQCTRPYWGVSVSYKNQTWGFFYDDNGTVDLTINPDGTIQLVAGAGGQVIPGNGAPQCYQ